MENNPTWIWVVALAARDDAGRVLLQQRPAGKHHGGLWEFPGGKVETNENPRLALQREVEEELAIRLDIARMEPLGFAEQAATGAGPAIVMLLYSARHWTGSVEPREGQEWGWFSLDAAGTLPMPPMDTSLLASLSD